MGQRTFLLLLFMPLLFQIIFGIKKVSERTKLGLAKVSIISFLLQAFFFYVSYKMLVDKLRAESNGQIHCGMPLVGLIGLEIIFIFLLIIVMIIQFLIRKSNRNSIEKR